MKKTAFLFLTVLLFGTSYAQSTRTRSSQRTVNGITEGWTVTEKLDAEGNVIDYDSSYYSSEGGTDEMPQDHNYQFYFGPDGGGRVDSLMDRFQFHQFPEFDFFFNDSSFFGDNHHWDYGFGPNNFFKLDSLFNQEGFSNDLEELFRKYGIDPDQLQQELQETSPADIPKGERI